MNSNSVKKTYEILKFIDEEVERQELRATIDKLEETYFIYPKHLRRKYGYPPDNDEIEFIFEELERIGVITILNYRQGTSEFTDVSNANLINCYTIQINEEFNCVLKDYRKRTKNSFFESENPSTTAPKVIQYFDLLFDFKNSRVWRDSVDKYDGKYSRGFRTKEKEKYTTNYVFQRLLEKRPDDFNDKKIFGLLLSKYTGNRNTKKKECWYDVYKALQKMVSEKFVKISIHGKDANSWIEFISEEEGLRLKDDQNR